MRYYLKIAHVDDNDFDLFSFDSLDAAIYYIKSREETDWVLSDTIFEEYPADDYTHILWVIRTP